METYTLHGNMHIIWKHTHYTETCTLYGNIHITLPYVTASGEFAVWLRELKLCSL